jgi:hypothetical protein
LQQIFIPDKPLFVCVNMPAQTRSMVARSVVESAARRPAILAFLEADHVARVLTYLDTKCFARFMLCSHGAIDIGRLSFYKTQIMNRRVDVSSLSAVAMASSRLFCDTEQRCLRWRQTTFLSSTKQTSERLEYQLVDVQQGPLWNFEWKTDPAEAAHDAVAIKRTRPSAQGLWILFNANHMTGGADWYRFSDK